MGLIGTLAVNVVARTEKLTRGLNKGRKDLARFTATARKATSVVTGFVGAFTAGVGIYGVTRSLQAAAERMDKLAKVSDKLGIASERLAGLQHAANQTGVATNTLNMALQRMTRRVSEAAQDTGEAVKALKELGLDARELNRLSPDQMFARIAEAISMVEGQSNKVRLAFKLFDSEGVDLVNTLNLGSDGLERMQAEAEKLGIAISREKLAEIERFNDAMDKLGKAFQGISNKILIDIAPAATDSINMLTEAVEGMRLLRGGGKKDTRSPREKSGGALAAIGGMINIPGGDKAGRMLGEMLFDRTLKDAPLDTGPLRPGFAEQQKKMGERLLRMGEKEREQYLKAVEKLESVPGHVQRGLESVGFGIARAPDLIRQGAGAGAGVIGDMAMRSQQQAERNASIRELEDRLEKAGTGGKSARNAGALRLVRSGTVEAYQQRAAIKAQADQQKMIQRQVRAAEKSRDHLHQINEKLDGGVVLTPSNIQFA